MSTATQPEALQLAQLLESFQEATASAEQRAAAELRRLHAENQQLRADLEAIGAGGVGPLMPRNPAACIAREFNTWSPNEGDTWYDDPADAQIIQIMFGIAESVTVGDEYELIAGWTGVTARYRITSVSADGDCEVECISHCLETDAPQLSTVKQTLTVDRQPLTDEQKAAVTRAHGIGGGKA